RTCSACFKPGVFHMFLYRTAAMLAVACLFAASVQAAPLNPGGFTTLAPTFDPAATVTVNTGTTPPSMSGGATHSGVVSGNVAVFCFGSVTINAGVTINVTGSRAFALLSQGSFTLNGTINGSGNLSVPGPGGGAGNA